MSLSTTTSKDIQTANGGTFPNDIYTYPFRILAESELEVYDDGVLLTLTTDYTVTGVGDANGGTISFQAGKEPVAASELILRRVVTVDQEVDIPSAPAKFPEESVEEALDKLTMIDQQQDEVASRALTFPADTNTDNVSNIIQDPVANAGKALTYSATGIAATTILSSDIASPVSTEGDLLTFTTVPAALPVGTDDQALVVDTGVAGKVKWATMPATRGDLLTRGASDNSILALGTAGQVVGSDGTDLTYMPTESRSNQGQCRLVYTNTTTLTLNPWNGNYLTLNSNTDASPVWETFQIPSAGVTLANTGLTAATLYYIYAYDNSGTVTLEGSTTGFEIDPNNGYAVKVGDNTRALVGLAYMDAGTPGTFNDAAIKRYTRSWYNDPGAMGSASYTANRGITSTSYVVANGEITMAIAAWANEEIFYTFSGSFSHSGASVDVGYGIGIDSTTVITSGKVTDSSTNIGNINDANHAHVHSPATSGLYTYTSLSKTASGTLTWIGSATEGCFATAYANGLK